MLDPARLRVLLAMDRGQIPRARVHKHLMKYVEQTQHRFEVPKSLLVLRFHAVYVMLVRHCAMHAHEWKDLTGTDDVKLASERMRAHLLDVSLGILNLRDSST